MNVELPVGQNVDLYTETGIAIGTQLIVSNITPNDVRLYPTQNAPTITDHHFPIFMRGDSARNAVTDPGAWAMCVGGGAVDVRAA